MFVPSSLHLTLLAFVVATALAGCSVPLDDRSSTEQTEVEEVTPVPVPGDDPSPAGFDETNVTDPERLAETHVDALEPPYVRNDTWVMVAEDKRLLRYEVRRVFERTGVTEIYFANGMSTEVLLTDHREANSLEEYRHNTRLQSGVDRAVDGEETSMKWWEASDTLREPVVGDDRRLLAAALSVARHTTNGSSSQSGGYLVTGSTSDPDEALVAPWLTNAENATVNVSLTSEGFVCSLELRYQALYNGQFVRIHSWIQYLHDEDEQLHGEGSCQ